ncbi:hypothetical protein HDIA_2256 [Hartmannibacter diazotrophicus]|uniref:Uncharacterized protein n=1 Tax=Hartmannibacter diazotrophicus TaxID=1482074 RepID=A0A2C9D662_9HYPH|nr:signal recognition particle [Hartmannibacter diazotrophicus]SON55797.1 hypothetical protein HDIA_2256 [Hartmannibacter diazotrophicus]
MKRFFLAACWLFASINVAKADDSLDVADRLGEIIGAEDACGLTLDQAAINRYVSNHVAADDLDFVGYLKTSTWTAKEDLSEMGATERSAHCMQVVRSAKAIGVTTE